LASYAKGTTTLSNLEVLTHKESDRFYEIKKQLQQIGISFEEDGFTLKIHGTNDKKEYFEYRAPDDHRMIMTTALHMMKNSGGMIINWKHVKKSFPGFFEEFK
jgi:3-phosphoshikimate 1-carboxyvinyltransferase